MSVVLSQDLLLLWLQQLKHILLICCKLIRQLKVCINHIKLHAVCKERRLVSDSLGLVDFAIRLVNSVLNLPGGQVKLFEEFKS